MMMCCAHHQVIQSGNIPVVLFGPGSCGILPGVLLEWVVLPKRKNLYGLEKEFQMWWGISAHLFNFPNKKVS